jgi:hypothetical protein
MRQANDTLSREIADSSVRYDRERKLPLYARFAIPEVWPIEHPGARSLGARGADGRRLSHVLPARRPVPDQPVAARRGGVVG